MAAVMSPDRTPDRPTAPPPIETRIRANNSVALVDFAELRRHRDLLSMFVWRDFATKYKQTILGPLWFLVQPLLPALVFTVIFGHVAGMSTEGVPAFVFFLCNQVAWGYFATNFSSVSNTLLVNLSLFSKVYFPRLLAPISSLISNLITLVIQLSLLAATVAWAHFRSDGSDNLHLSWTLLLFPLVVVHLAAMALGFGLWMAALTAKYRDLQQVSALIVQVWMYGSAVMYPLSQMTGKYRLLLSANPATFVIEAARVCLIGVGTVTWGTGIWSAGVTLLALWSGLRLFNRTAQTFVDVA
jgi:homopolymeric O-antigen transport system permease protein